MPSPYGDREEAWRADFFTPAGRLLAKAPWVFVRGNHEDCTRGGYGWTYYFGETDQACEIVHRTAHIQLTGLDLFNVDSAHADDKFARDEINQYWNAEAEKLRSEPPSAAPLIVLTHEPGYGVCPGGCRETADTGGLRTIADAVRSTGRRTILMTGHIHTFEAIDVMPVTLGGGRGVTQMIVGTGGSSLDKFGTPIRRSRPWFLTTIRASKREPTGSGSRSRRAAPRYARRCGTASASASWRPARSSS